LLLKRRIGGWWFEFGAAATALFNPVVGGWFPESIACGVSGNGRSLGRASQLGSHGHTPVERVPVVSTVRESDRSPIIFSPHLCGDGSGDAAYFLPIRRFYFILQWGTKIVATGFTPSSGGGRIVWANVRRLGRARCLRPLSIALRPQTV